MYVIYNLLQNYKYIRERTLCYSQAKIFYTQIYVCEIIGYLCHNLLVKFIASIGKAEIQGTSSYSLNTLFTSLYQKSLNEFEIKAQLSDRVLKKKTFFVIDAPLLFRFKKKLHYAHFKLEVRIATTSFPTLKLIFEN